MKYNKLASCVMIIFFLLVLTSDVKAVFAETNPEDNEVIEYLKNTVPEVKRKFETDSRFFAHLNKANTYQDYYDVYTGFDMSTHSVVWNYFVVKKDFTDVLWVDHRRRDGGFHSLDVWRAIENAPAVPSINTGDLTVLGIASNAKKADIINLLGPPGKEGILEKSMNAGYYMAYGGVVFNLIDKSDGASIDSILIDNRDAVTVRNIGVGDTDAKIINKYGNSYQLVNDNEVKEYRYIWGRPNSDDAHGIVFCCSNGIIIQIRIFH